MLLVPYTCGWLDEDYSQRLLYNDNLELWINNSIFIAGKHGATANSICIQAISQTLYRTQIYTRQTVPSVSFMNSEAVE
jgi:hypothetical protein